MYIENLNDGSILLTAPAMVPYEKDCDYTRGEPPLTPSQIKQFKESYEDYRFVDHEHEITKTGRTRGTKYKSYLLDKPTKLELFDGTIKEYPTGTWMMTSHVTDPESIKIAKNGGYDGYSVAVRSKETADRFKELINNHDYSDAEALKSQSQGGLIKDIPDPVVLSVALTKKPCLSASKYCKIRDGDNMSEENKVKTKVLEALGMSKEADVEALKSQVGDIDAKIEQLRLDNAEALKSMKEEITSAFTDALKEAFADKSGDEEEGEEQNGEKPEDNQGEEEGTEGTNPEEGSDKSTKVVETHGKSKQKPNHNANNGADKSQQDIYEYLGRNPDGTRK